MVGWFQMDAFGAKGNMEKLERKEGFNVDYTKSLVLTPLFTLVEDLWIMSWTNT